MTVTPAQPVTEAQRARYRRMVEVATMIVTTGGEDALQMSEMPALAEVSLATLYRYFPSKEHLLFAVVQQHLESLLARAHPSQRAGLTVRDRVAHNLLRAFDFDQRVPALGSVVRRLARLSDPAFRAERERVGRLQLDIVLKVAEPMAEYQRQLLSPVLHAAGGAIESWMAGLGSPDDVRFVIHTACRLLDLPPADVEADRALAAAPQR
ncbi:MAG TPA: TetR/AcrR family transcriptional regulator [Streptosporangiaceae bacterium]|nr:TetR/AcrR family transcriptional regulator [Streptosporangiaceae bacterium]